MSANQLHLLDVRCSTIVASSAAAREQASGSPLGIRR
jgi:hypothetical protein